MGSVEFFKDRDNLFQFMEDATKIEDYTGMLRIKDYKIFEQNFYKDVSEKDKLWTVFGNSFRLKSDNQTTIGICCLNSAWRCYRQDDRGHLLIGESQLAKHSKFIDNCSIKIALIHHPLDGFADVERRIISDHIYKDFDLLLIGHSHETITSMQTSLTGTLFINLAPSGVNDVASDSRTFSNGFSVIDFDKEKGEIDCSHLRFNLNKKEFVPNTDAGMNGTGKAHYDIPDAPRESKLEMIRDIIKNINEERLPEFDEHLVGSRAPLSNKSLKEEFLLPPIDDGRSSSNDEPIDEILTVNQIIKSKFNQFFFGNSESGKTILLYRLTVECKFRTY